MAIPVAVSTWSVRLALATALERVDGSSGAIGSAVNRAITVLVSAIAKAPADDQTRAEWLERLFDAHAADEIPCIETLSDHWGELCVSKETASLWADRLLERTRIALGPVKDVIWPYKRWAAKALRSQGRRAEAVRYAEACRGSGASDWEIDTFCEELLLESGLAEDAYRRYGLNASRAGTYLAWFRAVKKKYTHKAPGDILADLVALTPGEEGKWFAAAKDAGLFDEAVALVSRAPTDPRTLTRATRDFAETQPALATESGIAALRWIAEGYGYEITGAEVLSAYQYAMKAAAQQCNDTVPRDVSRVDTKKKRGHEPGEKEGRHDVEARVAGVLPWTEPLRLDIFVIAHEVDSSRHDWKATRPETLRSGPEPVAKPDSAPCLTQF